MKEENCQQCNNPFKVFDEDLIYYESIGVPIPKQCPECRLIRRLHERNTKNLYYRNCDFSGKKTLSHYHEEHPFPVYSPAAWWSYDWEPLKYGRDFDFTRPFFEQFFELKNSVPHLALFNTEGTLENSEYNNCTAYLKNCYLVAETDYCEDCYYGNLLKKSRTLIDCSICYECEACYECIDWSNCYNLKYSQDCISCSDSYFLKNCIQCSDCIGTINQRHKQYMIFNKQYTQEEYKAAVKAFALDTVEGVEALRKECYDFFLTQPHKAVIGEQNQNSSGDHISNSKNAFNCFDSKDLEDCRYCQKLSLGVKSSMDYNSWGNKAELIYQSSGCGDNCYNLKFCVNCQSNVRDSEYCFEMFSSSNCFGCVSLKKASYCILNKQYSKEDYIELKAKIIEHMKKTGEYGEFFPIEIAPFAYNESFVIDTFPITKEEATVRGYRWRESKEKANQSQTYNVPEKIENVKDDICNALLACSICQKNYKIIPQELKLYRQLNSPIPQKCPMCRHRGRMALRNPLKLWERECAKCNSTVKTSFAPERSEIIYCEKCYLDSVY